MRPRSDGAGATLVVWRCFGAGLALKPSSESSLVDEHWKAYRELGATGLQQAYRNAAQGAVESYNAKCSLGSAAELRERCDGDQAAAVGCGENGLLESSDEEACWPGLRPMVPSMLPIPCAYYDHNFLSQPDADRLLRGLVGEQSEVVWAIGGQAAKRYTAVYCDDGLGEYAGGLGYANDVMRPWTPVLRELRDRVATWHKQKTGRDVTFNVALLNRYDNGTQSLGYHADREEQDPSLEAPRSSPIASVSLGCERVFGFRRCQLPADLRHRQKLQAAALRTQNKAVRSHRSQETEQRRRSCRSAEAMQQSCMVVENIPQPVEYKNDFHWTGPKTEMSSGKDGNADAAGLPTVLELVAAEASECGTKGRRSELKLGHGSLICMENACQFLYRHSLLPEPGLGEDAGPRVNLTFRSKTSTYPSPLSAITRLRPSSTKVRVLERDEALVTVGSSDPHDDTSTQKRGSICESTGKNIGVFVGRMPGVHQRPRGFKDTMFHPFESPFIDDSPEVAAARYRTWLRAQPAFMRWVCEQLRGTTLLCTNDPWDIAHARALADIVASSESMG